MIAGRPATERVEVDDDTIAAALDVELADGATTKEAASAVAVALEVPRNRVYKLAIARRG